MEIVNALDLDASIVERYRPVAEALIIEYARGSTIPAGVENEGIRFGLSGSWLPRLNKPGCEVSTS